jgi:hypothetical protein
MERRDFRVDIDEAVASLRLSPEDFKLVNLYKYEQILVSILDKFTTLGKHGLSCAWLWQHFKEPQFSFYSENAWKHLPEIVEPLLAPEETFWFIAEDDRRTKQNGNFWLYEGKLKPISSLLGEMTAFEYYLVPKKLDWLLCETHHDVLIRVGEPIIERLKAKALVSENAA